MQSPAHILAYLQSPHTLANPLTLTYCPPKLSPSTYYLTISPLTNGITLSSLSPFTLSASVPPLASSQSPSSLALPQSPNWLPLSPLIDSPSVPSLAPQNVYITPELSLEGILPCDSTGEFLHAWHHQLE